MNTLADTKRFNDPSTVSYMSLPSQTRAIVKRVSAGQTVLVKDDGKEQAILIEPIDYRILLAMLAYHTASIQKQNGRSHNKSYNGQDSTPLFIGLHEDELLDMTTQERWNRVISAYLDEEINLGRAADLLKVSRLHLDERFWQLNIPRYVGPVDIEDIRAEIDVALRTQVKASQLASD